MNGPPYQSIEAYPSVSLGSVPLELPPGRSLLGNLAHLVYLHFVRARLIMKV